MITRLDMNRLREITEGDAALERQLFHLFIESVDRLLQLLAVQIQDGSLQWRQTVHQIKGASANMHVTSMVALCISIEKLENEAHRREQITQLHEVYQQVRAELVAAMAQPQ
jgi:HPt (histidine-containing phosphotransfer) domain-containing protein